MNIIKNIREKRGYTQSELAKKTGLSLRTIQRLESKNKEPKGHTLTALSDAFNINVLTLQDQFKSIEHTKESEIARKRNGHTTRLENRCGLCRDPPFHLNRPA